MILDNYEFNITKASSKEHILSIKGINYLIGEVVYVIIEGCKNGENYKKIVETINQNKDYSHFQEEDVEHLINTQIIPLLEAENIEKRKNPVKSLFILMKPYKYPRLINAFNFLFSPVFFWIAFLSLAFFSCYFFITSTSSFGTITNLKAGWILTFLFTYVVIFIHEMGHVVAASKYKVTAKEIGFGFYFIYPALYTDLTEIWKLNKKERIIINLGGMFFQMLINVVLAILIIVIPEYKSLFISFFLSNMALVFFNFNPLFKFDAYWIFSDFFEIHNLRDQSNRVLLSVFKKNSFPKIEPKKKIPLVVYSICYLFFMVLVWTFICKYFFNNSVDLYTIYKTKNTSFTEFNTLKKIFGFGFTLFLVIRIIMSLVNVKKIITF